MIEDTGHEIKKLTTCAIDSCDDSVMAKGWCRKHYQRNYKYGDPTFIPIRGKKSSPSNECKVSECETIGSTTRGYCPYHYYSFRQYGDPLVRKRRLSPEETLNRRVDKSSDPKGCWIWTGYSRPRSNNKNGKPYGELDISKGRRVFAHRLSYEVHNNVKLEAYQPVHHKCSNTLCINPDHLQLVTAAENTAEMLERHSYINRIKDLEEKLKNCTCGIGSDVTK